MPNTFYPLPRTYNKVFLCTGMTACFLLTPTIFAVCSIVKNLHSLGFLKLEIIKKNLEGPTKKFDKFVDSSPFLKRMNLESKYFKEDFSTSFSKIELLAFFIIGFSIAFHVISAFLSLAIAALAIGIYAKSQEHKEYNEHEIQDPKLQDEGNNAKFPPNQRAQENLKRYPTKIQHDQNPENKEQPSIALTAKCSISSFTYSSESSVVF